MTEQTFEELVTKVASLTDTVAKYETTIKALTASKDEEEDDTKKAFKKAMKDMDEKEKDANSHVAQIAAVRQAFKQAAEEKDEDKKKEAMKKAVQLKAELDASTSKVAEKDDEDDKKKEAVKIASLENKMKLPIIKQILSAAKIFEPKNIAALEAKLKTASLEEVEEMWNVRQPYIAVLGGNKASPIETPYVPFLAGMIDNELVASGEQDYGKMDSEKLLRSLYQ